MLVAMAITLVMMAAVVTLFANVSNGVRNRRATIEMSGQVRQLRNKLQQDLQNATCPGLTWQRPESNHGYIEIIEGQYRDSRPSMLTDGNPDSDGDGNPGGNEDELKPDQSIIPQANDGTYVQPDGTGGVFTANGLGDYDDILMLTVRNEHEPFVGPAPSNVRPNAGNPIGFANWQSETIESPLAEVIWFAIENPDQHNDANNFFGEPGMRTIYRRALLIAPWINPYSRRDNNGNEVPFQHDGDTFKAEPGLVRILPSGIDQAGVAEAIAAIIAFQDRYDLSCRLEWDHNVQRWKIMANTLGDLTKRENRFGHYGFHFSGSGPKRLFPYAMVSTGLGYSGGSANVGFIVDPEIGGPAGADATAHVVNAPVLGGTVASYSVDHQQSLDYPFPVRPLAFVSTDSGMSATARAMLNDDGVLVRVVHGPVPLWGPRRGQDVIMTDALAFDLRVYDPGAPLFGARDDPSNPSSSVSTILEPSDTGWTTAYAHGDNMGSGEIGTDDTVFPYSGQGAYVDLGYGYDVRAGGLMPSPKFASAFSSASSPWFFAPRALSDVAGGQLAPGYAVYDTWSFHYENNGRDDDGDNAIDEGTNGIDDVGNYYNPATDTIIPDTRLGIDDVGERETVPPYDKPLRGVQALVRVYERDSRAIRQVRVNQHFMPE
jgi:hypothetical protein